MHKKSKGYLLIPIENRNASLIQCLDSFTTDMYHLHAYNLLEVKPVDVILDVGCAEGHFQRSACQKERMDRRH